MKNDEFGNRMKNYEELYSSRLMPLLPIYARLDGKNFSAFTKGMNRPYDERMVFCMHELTKYLIEEFNATIGYTQSDEISLAWANDNYLSEMLFDGKLQKWISILASETTVKFNELVVTNLPEEYSEKLPVFDCRILQFPSFTECTNMFLWRVQDARKNSISMAAQSVYSHKELQNKNGDEKLVMLGKKDINWHKYPWYFKQGQFFRKIEVPMTQEEMNKIPDKYKPTDGNPIIRKKTMAVEYPDFSHVLNRDEVIWKNEKIQYIFPVILESKPKMLIDSDFKPKTYDADELLKKWEKYQKTSSQFI